MYMPLKVFMSIEESKKRLEKFLAFLQLIHKLIVLFKSHCVVIYLIDSMQSELERLSTIESCKIENLSLKVLLNSFMFIVYFRNIPPLITNLCDKIPYTPLSTGK